jgi:pyruvate kinase
MRRAKIVATLGPATTSYEQILGLVEAGMDVARLNLSHGTYADHSDVYEHVRRASDVSGRAIGILVDLQGPKIRLGRFASGPVLLGAGDTFTITTDDVPGDRDMVSTTYSGLPGDVARRDPRGRRRSGVGQQGSQSSRRRGERASAVGEGH